MLQRDIIISLTFIVSLSFLSLVIRWREIIGAIASFKHLLVSHFFRFVFLQPRPLHSSFLRRTLTPSRPHTRPSSQQALGSAPVSYIFIDFSAESDDLDDVRRLDKKATADDEADEDDDDDDDDDEAGNEANYARIGSNKSQNGQKKTFSHLVIFIFTSVYFDNSDYFKIISFHSFLLFRT